MAVNADSLEPLRYPVGRPPRGTAPLDAAERGALIEILERAPAHLRSLAAGLGEARLDTPYRPGGWTIRQVIHHLPDSHMNAYVRMKLAVTESAPAIKTYEEARWADLPDARSGPIAASLDLLDALHRRWTAFLRALPNEGFARPFVHPEWGRQTVDDALRMYAWHCRHHTAHVRLGSTRHPRAEAGP
jgi:hypothetical protein